MVFGNSSSFVCLYIVIHVSLSLKDSLTCYGFYSFKWFNQGSYLVGVHGIHLRFHGLKLFLRINIRYCFHLVSRLIKYEQFVIFSFYEKYLSFWYMTRLTRSMKFLCFLSSSLNIQCYNLELRFYLDVSLWFLNLFKFYFHPLLFSRTNTFFRIVTCFEVNTFGLIG